MGKVYALIPAKARSTGIPAKNWRSLAGGQSCVERAIACAERVGCDAIYVSSDLPPQRPYKHYWLQRPTELAQDTSAMIDVVRHALKVVPGEPDDIWLLLQPTAPLRRPEHLQEAIRLLQETGADSVVSVKELPKTHSPEVAFRIDMDRLWPWDEFERGGPALAFAALPYCRQDHDPAYIRDGTVYAFWRRTVAQFGHIYGKVCRPLIIPPEETCELDTEQDWAALEARLRRG